MRRNLIIIAATAAVVLIGVLFIAASATFTGPTVVSSTQLLHVDGLEYKFETEVGKPRVKQAGSNGTAIDATAMAVIVRIRAKNVTDTKRLTYVPWTGRSKCRDQFGNTCDEVYGGNASLVPTDRATGAKQIDPGDYARDVLAFELPVQKATEVRFLAPTNTSAVESVIRWCLAMSDKETWVSIRLDAGPE